MNDFKSLLTLQEVSVSVRVETPHQISSEVLECCYYAVIRDIKVRFVNRMILTWTLILEEFKSFMATSCYTAAKEN